MVHWLIVYARAVIPAKLQNIPYEVWAPNGHPASPAQWQHTLFASTDNQVQFTIDAHANSTRKAISAFFKEELMNREDGGDRVNDSVLKGDRYVILGTNNQGFKFYKKLYALPKVNLAKNYQDYVQSTGLPSTSFTLLLKVSIRGPKHFSHPERGG